MEQKKTIRQIAEELGVSKQAVQQRMKREPLYTSIQSYISTVDGTKYIDVDGENLIKSAYQKNEEQPIIDNVHSNTPDNQTENVHSNVYSILHETIETLRKQLEVKDEQILMLTEINKNLSASINADRHNELAETYIDGQQKLIENGKPTKRKWQLPFWKKKEE